MFFRSRGARPVRYVLTVLAGFAVVTGCGPDLGKANFPRTTVPAAATGGQSADGKINDPAVAIAALRTVDPCGLVDAAAVADLGAPGKQDPFGLDKCSNEVTDAGGKTIRISVQLGEPLIGVDNDISGTVEGLPLIERKQDTAACFVTAVTARAPDLGVTVQTRYEGGDPCRPGRSVLQKVLKKLRDKPAQYPQQQGSLMPVDLCTTADDAAVTELLGKDIKKEPFGLHGCTWTPNGSGPNATLNFRVATTPGTSDGTEVDLGGGVKGFQKSRSESAAQCNIVFQHRPTTNGEGELVSFDYNNYLADAGSEDACGKALKVVKAVVPKLPSS
ncbi:DUF3558 family protein [Amycolatopsis nigrescens]|uniref:DUF3558 family protein n=1 Tax=Amycolatopsis nigrescens TaxID=381445 RepID=UPI0012FA46ED|nr:DUF3558 family protein [Amycolatopsis nigrescens]